VTLPAEGADSDAVGQGSVKKSVLLPVTVEATSVPVADAEADSAELAREEVTGLTLAVDVVATTVAKLMDREEVLDRVVTSGTVLVTLKVIDFEDSVVTSVVLDT
jgi:hypothetical protein